MKIKILSFAALVATAAALPACDSAAPAATTAATTADAGIDTTGDTGTSGDTGPVGDGNVGNAEFVARGSIRQVFVTHAQPAQALELRDGAGKAVAQGTADKWGSHIFRKVAPGKGYRVHDSKQPTLKSAAVDVLDAASSLPPQSFYTDQKVGSGVGYLKMRDGTTLAYFATLPGPADKGPYPTIVNYSGYDPAKPGKPLVPKEQQGLCETVPALCAAPSDASALVMALGGYATVSVNIRGTGCSGGAYDYFEELQLLDGYDIVEAVAAQPWVAFHKVGMTGLSYPGITQLFVAKTAPPSLGAIAPLSVIGNTATTLVPGGILNKGFALQWISHVFAKAAPYGQGWEQAQVDAGDTICKENQLLHDQRVNNVDQAKDKAYYTPETMDPLNPSGFAKDITVPVFLACAFQDEQTGPFFTTLLNQFTKSPARRFMVYNGLHSDGFAPQILVEFKAFFDLYIAKEVPSIPSFWALAVPQFTQTLYGVSVPLPEDRWTKHKSHAEALAAWQKEPELQVWLDNGGSEPAGTPVARHKLELSQWPPEETQVQRWYFGQDGVLLAQAPTLATGGSTFKLDPKAGERGIEAKNLWSAKPNYVWKKPAAGFEVAFETPALAQDQVMVGTGSVDLWVRTSAADVTDADLEVNLSEVRADGQEQYIQSGWLRASFRNLAPWATELWPEPNMLVKDSAPILANQWQQVRVAIAGFGHVFRKGSKIRIAVDTPGDSRVDWRFDLLTWNHPVSYDIGHSLAQSSSVALPLLTGVTLPKSMETLPTCTLRGQPCRLHSVVANVAVDK